MKWYEDKEYQEMCEGAEKIQKDHQWKFGDFFLHKGHKPPIVLVVNEEDLVHGDMYCACCEGDRIWLPTQEDLQEIYCKEKDCAWVDFLLDFSGWLYTSRKETITKAYMMQALAKKWNSETQLKLAFVMDKIFDKPIWNPETRKWEKTETQ